MEGCYDIDPDSPDLAFFVELNPLLELIEVFGVVGRLFEHHYDLFDFVLAGLVLPFGLFGLGFCLLGFCLAFFRVVKPPMRLRFRRLRLGEHRLHLLPRVDHPREELVANRSFLDHVSASKF